MSSEAFETFILSLIVLLTVTVGVLGDETSLRALMAVVAAAAGARVLFMGLIKIAQGPWH